MAWLSQILVTPDFGRSDAWHFSFITKYLLGVGLHKGELPLWNSNIGAGFPLIGEGQMGAFYLPNIILFRLFDPVIAYNLALVVALALLGVGMFVWLRLMQYPNIPSLVAALTLSISGMVIAQLPHITLIQGFSMLPWVAAATLLFSQKKTIPVLVLWALLVSQQLLAGFPQASFITALFVSCYYLWLIKNQAHILVSIVWFSVAALFSLGLSAIQLVPSWEFLSQSNAAGGLAPETASYFSYPLKHLVTLLFPFALGSPKDASYPAFTTFDGSIFWENVGGIGPLPIILLLFLMLPKVLKRGLTPASWFFLMSIAVSFLLMLGKYSPLYLLYSFFPFNLFRVPSRFIWILIPSILVLATEAGTKLWQTTAYKILIRSLLTVAAVANSVFLLYSWLPYHSIESADQWLSPPPSTAIIQAGEGRIMTVGAEAAHNQLFLSEGWSTPNAYQFLKNSLAPNSNVLWDIPSSQVYAGRFLRRPNMFEELLAAHLTASDREATVSATGKKLLDMLSVTTVMAALPLTHTGLVERASWTNGDQTITAWQNPTSVARAYLARTPVVATTKEEAFAAIVSNEFISGRNVIVEQPVALQPPPSGEPGRVTVLPQAKETELAIRVEQNTTRAILVVTDTYYPGWIATVDGEKTPLFPVNIRQMGMIVPAGDHEVKLRFILTSLYLGMTISGASLIILIALMAFPIVSAGSHRYQEAPLPAQHRPRNHGTSRPHKGTRTDQA